MDSIGTALVADHDPARLDALAALVTELGFTALKYSDANAAREFLHTRPDLDAILCEMDMEGLSWNSAKRSLQEMEAQIPVILFSDEADTERIMRALRVGASDFFTA